SIGVGLNVNNDPPEQEAMAVSLKAVAGHHIPRREILTGYLDRFEKRLTQFDSQSVIADWKKNNMTIGNQVIVKTFKDTVQGRAKDIDPGGGLILQLEDGRLQTIVHGDCFQRH
ncbi:MAG: hypothetical protein V2I35_02635, partial [Desulfocapsaceae bacterium]|nr:hypothetical protein [Desulfocapsaceae bacterium]